jgi:hypothetical protein
VEEYENLEVGRLAVGKKAVIKQGRFNLSGGDSSAGCLRPPAR